MMAKVMMADELTKLQDIYLHAVTRHIILQREADAYIASTATGGGGDKDAFHVERAHGTRATPRRIRSGGSRFERKRDGVEERRERLLATATRVAPPVTFANLDGNLTSVRCVMYVCDTLLVLAIMHTHV